ncbi:hypothetical protein [Novosphingobium gossypii]|uniref:hypothetical protein n=1 Tax=Novosphingobium gossypii TaxID=1604774 RepID=UPI003D1B47AD
MPSEVTTGHGSQLWITIAGTPVRVAEVDDIPEEPNFTTTLYETSSFDTVAVKEFKKHPLKEGAEFTISGNRVLGSASQVALAAAEAAEGALPYRIVLPQGEDTYEVTGSALFYNLKYLNNANEKRRFQITMKPTSASTTAEEDETP